MTPDALNFTGDAVTYLGLIGVISTLIIVVTSFRRYFNSPLRKWWLLSPYKLPKFDLILMT